jgi:hypothetical protein
MGSDFDHSATGMSGNDALRKRLHAGRTIRAAGVSLAD